MRDSEPLDSKNKSISKRRLAIIDVLNNNVSKKKRKEKERFFLSEFSEKRFVLQLPFVTL